MVVYSVYSTRNEKSEIERSSEEYFEGSSQYTVTTVRGGGGCTGTLLPCRPQILVMRVWEYKMADVIAQN